MRSRKGKGRDGKEMCVCVCVCVFVGFDGLVGTGRGKRGSWE